MRIGLISDTHGLLRPEALAALEGADMILHAGDVGGAEVISGLEALAPTRAVRGNNDRDPFGLTLPHELSLELEGVGLYMVHDRADIRAGADIRGGAAGCGVAITGHSHRPGIEEVDGVLHINPGSAGPRRFRLPISVALLELAAGRAHAELIELELA